MIYSAVYKPAEFVELTLASDGEAIVALWLAGQKYFGEGADADVRPDPSLAAFKPAFEWLDAYFAGEAPSPHTLLLRPQGSTFRKRVWDKLLAIPYGATRTYGDIGAELAREDGKSTFSAQAVGGAVGHNPISIIIPCHRVVGSNGSLTGYAGGIARKVWLLEHEGAVMEGLFTPAKSTAP